jgi:hypothetical protein
MLHATPFSIPFLRELAKSSGGGHKGRFSMVITGDPKIDADVKKNRLHQEGISRLPKAPVEHLPVDLQGLVAGILKFPIRSLKLTTLAKSSAEIVTGRYFQPTSFAVLAFGLLRCDMLCSWVLVLTGHPLPAGSVGGQ